EKSGSSVDLRRSCKAPLATIELTVSGVASSMSTGLARRNVMHQFPLYCLLACLLPSAATATGPAANGASGEALMRHVQVLASDDFEGRAPATAGEDKTIAYLVEEFR